MGADWRRRPSTWLGGRRVCGNPDRRARNANPNADDHGTAQPTAAPVVSPATGAMLSPVRGPTAFLWWRPEVAHRDLQLMREGGFNWVKQAFLLLGNN